VSGPYGLLDSLLLSERANEESRKSHTDLSKCHVYVYLLSTLFLTTVKNVPKHTCQEQLESLCHCHLAALGMWNMKCVFGKKDLEIALVDKAASPLFSW
jgi:hypothetical protein